MLQFALLIASIATAELPSGPQVIHTRDGRALRGVIVAQVDDGYLLQMAGRTELVAYAVIQDVLPDETVPALPPPPAPPASRARQVEAEPVPAVEAVEPDWREDRKGFHWTAGAGGMVDFTTGSVTGGFVGAYGAVRFGFGWLDLQVELMPLGEIRNSTRTVFLALNPQLRINFARFYSLGVGLWSAATVVPSVDFVVGPSVSPAIFRFGEVGQHEVRFWATFPFLSTTPAQRGRAPIMLLSYAYAF